ncbi:hypothetical protein ATO6_23495 [Oceanicola sp. 22II-s10i]|uniref:hypothetical protein n=1 Tax=Oceanicola sp. 22II-s10i TaxID=1317116 RepID=UPI000B525E00|nr:hypothetical protein [Oceanicola sp. 22II-s10i]OWU81709.1 hypothetical protein ATO6_23495 [Oceanicola sp. 22II-s10i]
MASIGPNTRLILEDIPARLAAEFLNLVMPSGEVGANRSFDVASLDGTSEARLEDHDICDLDAELLEIIEAQSVRVVELSGDVGDEAIQTVVAGGGTEEQSRFLLTQFDEIGRSCWTFVNLPTLFQDAESYYHVRRDRERSGVYSTFALDLEEELPAKVSEIDLPMLVLRLTEVLKLGDSPRVSAIELEANRKYPASVMLFARHGAHMSSVYAHQPDGTRKPLYFRPQDEIKLVYTPGARRIEVLGVSFRERHTVANAFAEVVLKQNVSERPLSERIFDLSRFTRSFELCCPDIADIQIESAVVTEFELLLGSFARRVSLKVTKEDDIGRLASRYLSGALRFRGRAGINRVVISVGYRLPDVARLRTFKITVMGANASDVLGHKDRRLRELGLGLLRAWKIMREVTPPDQQETVAIFPGLLRLFELGEDVVTGLQIAEFGLTIDGLLAKGFLKQSRRQTLTLQDREDDQVIEAEVSDEESFSPEAKAFTRYRLEPGWCREFIATELTRYLDVADVREIEPNLYALGSVKDNGRAIPVYLARRLDDLRAMQGIETELRSRDAAGPGIVLCAGTEAPRFLVENIAIPVTDIWNSEADAAEGRDRMLARFSEERSLRMGTHSPRVARKDNHVGTLLTPWHEPLTLNTAVQIRFFEALASAWNSGEKDVHSKTLTDGSSARSPREVFTGARRKLVFDTYVEKGEIGGWWRLKT